MADENLNPLRKAFKKGAGGRNLKEEVKRRNEGLKKEARGEVVRRRRNISDEVSPPKADDHSTLSKGAKAAKRREELLAWKARRDHKKEQDVKRRGNNHGFVVKHVKHSPPKYLIGENSNAKRQKNKLEEPVVKRVTRSSARIANKTEENRKILQKESAPKTRGAKHQNKTENNVKKRPAQSTMKDEKDAEVKNENKEDNAAPNSQRRSAKKGQDKSGFVFTINQNGTVPKSFNFSKMSPVHFSTSVPGFQDPIARFHESIKSEKETSFEKGKARSSFMVGSGEDPIARFNASLKSEGRASMDGFNLKENESNGHHETPQKDEEIKITDKKEEMDVGDDKTRVDNPEEMIQDGLKNIDEESKENEVTMQTPPKSEFAPSRVLRETPQRSAYRIKNLAKEESILNDRVTKDTPSNILTGCPGKTPKMLSAVPKDLLQEMNSERFTPRRIKSTKHFKDLLEKERVNFTKLNAYWSGCTEEDLAEEVSGQIRTVIGQAQLLMDQRFVQFESLIKVHQSHQAHQGATASDLQGFWDMISYQIEDVHRKFSDLETRKQNGWTKEETKKTTKPKKVIENKKKGDKMATRKRPDKTRQEEMRNFKKAMRTRMQSLKSDANEEDVQILTGPSDDARTSVDKNTMFNENTQTEDESASGRSRSSSSEMSSDSLEDGAEKLCTRLENVKIKSTKEVEPTNTAAPLKDIDNILAHHQEEIDDFDQYLRPTVRPNDESLLGFGFSCSPKKKRQSAAQINDISLIKFD